MVGINDRERGKHLVGILMPPMHRFDPKFLIVAFYGPSLFKIVRSSRGAARPRIRKYYSFEINMLLPWTLLFFLSGYFADFATALLLPVSIVLDRNLTRSHNLTAL